MEQARIDRLLYTLENAFLQLETHWSWVQLKESERQPQSPPLISSASQEIAEFRHARAAFLGALVEVLNAVNKPLKYGLTPSDCNKLRREALKVKSEYDNLNFPKSL